MEGLEITLYPNSLTQDLEYIPENKKWESFRKQFKFRNEWKIK